MSKVQMSKVQKHADSFADAMLDAIRLVVREEIRAALKITGTEEADRPLDAEEAAQILGVSKDRWIIVILEPHTLDRKSSACISSSRDHRR